MSYKSTIVVLSVEFILAVALIILYYFVHSHLSSLTAALSMAAVYVLGVVTKTTGEQVIRMKLDEMEEELNELK